MRAKFYFILIFNFIFDVYIFGGLGWPHCATFVFSWTSSTCMAQQALLRYMYTDEKLHVSPLLAQPTRALHACMPRSTPARVFNHAWLNTRAGVDLGMHACSARVGCASKGETWSFSSVYMYRTRGPGIYAYTREC